MGTGEIRGEAHHKAALGKDPDPEDHNPADGGYRVNQSAPVGSYPDGASPYGVLDMSDNVWEWTLSAYREYPYRSDDGRENPDAPGARRVLRGGAFDYGQTNARCAYRYHYNSPYYRDGSNGFRVAVAPFSPTSDL